MIALKKSALIFVTVIVVLLFGSCVKVHSIKLASAPHGIELHQKYKSADKIHVYRSDDKPGYEYDEIAMITVGGKEPHMPYIMRIMREEALKKGGDCVINFRIKLKRDEEYGSFLDHLLNLDTDVPYEVIKYLASGTVIRKKVEEK